VGGESLGREDSSTATVLVAEFRGLSALATRLRPELVLAFFEELLGAAADLAVAQEGRIEAREGDAIVLTWGIPRRGERDGLRAVRTALGLQFLCLAVRNRWQAGVDSDLPVPTFSAGIATGSIGVADGDGAAKIFGEALVRAKRLCTAARPAEVLLDRSTRMVLSDREAPDIVSPEGAVRRRGLGGLGAHRCWLRYRGLRLVRSK
jgi:class 3 adenylate cyclase